MPVPNASPFLKEIAKKGSVHNTKWLYAPSQGKREVLERTPFSRVLLLSPL